MPPQLAAIFFWGFVIWLFRRDSKEFGRLRPALWIPFIWICINGTKALVYWFGNPGAADISEGGEGSFWDRNAYMTLMTLGMIVLLNRPILWNSVFAQMRWIVILYAYYLLTTLWAPDSFVAFKRWFKDLGDIVMILLILTDEKPLEALRVIFVRFAYLLVPLSVLVIKWFPAIGRYTHRWTYQTVYCGMSSNKNGLGLLAMVAAIFVIWQLVDLYSSRGKERSLRSMWPDIVIVLMCAWLLNLAGSVTASVCTVLWTLLFLGLHAPVFRKNLGVLRWFAAGAITFLICFTISPSLRGFLADLLGRSVTLSDRTLIWELAINGIVNPWIGAGFNGFWETRNALPIIEEYHVTHSHNGFLEIFMHTGFVGILLLLVVICRAGRNTNLHLALKTPSAFLFAALFWTIVFFNYTEIAFSRSNVFGLLLTLLAMTPPGTVFRWIPDQTSELPESAPLLDGGKPSYAF